MKVGALAVLLLLFGSAFAQEIECPEGTFKSAPEKQGKTLTLFCQRWNETAKGLLTKPTRELVMHGPFKVFEQTHPTFATYRLLKSGQMKDGKADGKVKEYYPDETLMTEYEVDSDGKGHGQFKKFHPNGAVRTVGQLESNNFVGVWKFYDPSGKLLAEGPYEEVKKAIDQYDKNREQQKVAEATRVQSEKKAEQKKRTEEIGRSWEKKKKGAVSAHYDKRAKRYWSDVQGMSNWFVAKQKCDGLGKGWYLPSTAEITEGDDNGLSSIVESYGGDQKHFWTVTDQSKETDSQRSMLLQDHKHAFVHMVDEGDSPGHKVRDSYFVICTSK